jgi:fibrillarin-like pre-rRNA processing protein
MRKSSIVGVYKKNGKLFTENYSSCKGKQVYNEKLVTARGREFRSWSPYRSKFAAAILKGLTNLDINTSSSILYLGAASGTTVSHISDIITRGFVYAVEYSAIVMKKLLELCTLRKNIIPILSDANHYENYMVICPQVQMIYQDISQRNQADIFVNNIEAYLIDHGKGIIMVKARSIDVAEEPKRVYKQVSEFLKTKDLKVLNIIELSPYYKDHAAIFVSRN